MQYIVASTFGRCGKTTLSHFVLGKLPGARIVEVESGGEEAEGKVLIKTDANESARQEVLGQYIEAVRAKGLTVFDVGDRDAMAVLRLLNTAAGSLFKSTPPVLVVPIVDDRDCALRFQIMDREIGPLKAAARKCFVVKNLSKGTGPALDAAATWASANGYTVCKTALPHAELLDNTINTARNTDLEALAATDLLGQLAEKKKVDAMEAARLGLFVMEAQVILPAIEALRQELQEV
ncbi:MAG: hypothetical protein M0038_10010 [Pseudomonadota bacterium]|jgi:hypothetical protein|nr:hypothetical protein [Pseudomonadota bacterium]